MNRDAGSHHVGIVVVWAEGNLLTGFADVRMPDILRYKALDYRSSINNTYLIGYLMAD